MISQSVSDSFMQEYFGSMINKKKSEGFGWFRNGKPDAFFSRDLSDMEMN